MDIPNCWRRRTLLSWLLLPGAGLFFLISTLRRHWQKRFAWRPPRPLIIVGNLSVGGNGKTPLVSALARALQSEGFQVGIISRGTGGHTRSPQLVFRDSDPHQVGDEPLLLALETGLPVAVGRSRRAAIELLLRQQPQIQVLLSDDGLQHYRLRRDVEIIALAPDFGLGNGFLLPAGPLRELPSRRADALVMTAAGPQDEARQLSEVWPLYGTKRFIQLHRADGTAVDWAELAPPFYGLTAIARPERFRRLLEQQLDCPLSGWQTRPDHSHFRLADLDFASAGTLLVTSKDAVKLPYRPNLVVVSYSLQLPRELVEQVKALLVPPPAP